MPSRYFTLQELEQKYGPDFESILGLSPTPLPAGLFTPKPVINHFAEFDETTQRAYHSLFRAIASVNESSFRLFATGSRVNGTWRTKEESDKRAALFKGPQKRVKYSDFDFVTDAINIPSLPVLLKQTGFKFDRLGMAERTVEVPAPNTLQNHTNLNN